MSVWIRISLISFLALVTLQLAGCNQSSELPQGPNAVWNLIVIGDATMMGLGEAYAAQIEKDVGVQVDLADFAIAGLSLEQIQKVLKTGETTIQELKALPDAVKDAEVVVMFVSPENSCPENTLKMGTCFTEAPADGCKPYAIELLFPEYRAIWAEIYKLRNGKPTILRATDMYDPFANLWREDDTLEPYLKCWDATTAAARLAAKEYDIPFLSRFEYFNGAGTRNNEDPIEKGYVQSDSQQTTELGNQYTASILGRKDYEPVPEP